ncbi:MAG TPA: hypothetical protein V6D14_33090 [Coleofasciculaceae cyanobacterium]
MVKAHALQQHSRAFRYKKSQQHTPVKRVAIVVPLARDTNINSLVQDAASNVIPTGMHP